MPHKLTSKMAAAIGTATDSLEDIPENISISYLPDNVKLADRILSRGLNYFTQCYIHDIKINNENKPRIKVVARCWRSMRKSEKPHTIHIEIASQKIIESYCTCKVGLTGHCSHIIGLVKTLQGFKLHGIKTVPDQLSSTSMPQQWHVLRGDKITAVPLNHVVVARPRESRKRKPVICQVDTHMRLPDVTKNDIEQLKGASGTPLEYLISASTPMVMTKLGEVQLGSFLTYQTRNLRTFKPVTTEGCGDLSINKTAPVKLPDNFETLKHSYAVPNPELIESSTRMQAGYSKWFQARHNRLTASKFGDVLYRKSAPNEKMLNKVFTSKQIIADSLNYGRRNEGKAKSMYLDQFPERHIHDCCLVINNEFPFLGATPDGKLCDNGQVCILEIKCPYSARDLTISEACSQIPDFFMQQDQNGIISLRENHSYYAQVQGQLIVTGCPFCDFVVYCPNEKDLFVQRFFPDFNFMEKMLDTLSDFFKEYAHSYLSNNTKS